MLDWKKQLRNLEIIEHGTNYYKIYKLSKINLNNYFNRNIC